MKATLLPPPPKDVLIAPGHEEEIDLRVYWNVINKYKGRIISLTLLIGILATLIVFALEPIYRSTATLLIEIRTPNIISIQEVSSGVGTDNFQTQLDILMSRNLWDKAIERLKTNNPEKFIPVKPKETLLGLEIRWRQWLPKWFPVEYLPEEKTTDVPESVPPSQGGLTVESVSRSRVVQINYESPDPELSALIPNLLADAYVESDLEFRLQTTQKASAWLIERLAGLRQKLEKSEKSLQEYIEGQNLVDVSGVKSVSVQQLNQITTDLVTARKRLSEISNIYEQIQALRAQSPEALESLPIVLSNTEVQALKAAEATAQRQVSELSKRFGPKHPEMIAVQSQLEAAKANTAKQVRRVIEGITKEYQVARANVAALEQSKSQNESHIQNINRKQYQLGVLERDVQANRQLYDLFLSRFKETNVSQTEQNVIGRIIDPALVPGKPYKPKKARLITITMMVALLFAIMLAFLLEYLDNTLKHGDDVEQRLNLPLLGTLPRLYLRRRDRGTKPLFMLLEDDKSHFAEAIRTMRTGLMLSNLDSPRKALIITSSLPSEGKTTFAVNQAFAFGQLEKTLLIDADMRRPSIGKAFGFSSKAPGLSELVAGTRSFADCVHPIETDNINIDLLPSGAIPPNPLELLSSKRFKEALTHLEDIYTHIIIDSAPTHAVSDALAIARYANAVVYVVKAESTPYQMVKTDIKRMHQAEATVVGVVLNQVNVKKLNRYYGGKYGYYGKYQYYGYGKY